MALKRVDLYPGDLKPRHIYDRLGVEAFAFVFYTGMETYVLYNNKATGEYRTYVLQEKEEVIFDDNNNCLILPEFIMFSCLDKENAALNFVEAAARGQILATAEKENAKPKSNPSHFDIKLRGWVKEEIDKIKFPNETTDEFAERAILSFLTHERKI